MGARTKCTKRRVDVIVEAIAGGATRTLAAKAANIHLVTLMKWLQQGRTDARGLKKELVERVEIAEVSNAQFYLDKLKQAAAEGDASTAKWMLERRHGYARPPTVVITNEEASPVDQQEMDDFVDEFEQKGTCSTCSCKKSP